MTTVIFTNRFRRLFIPLCLLFLLASCEQKISPDTQVPPEPATAGITRTGRATLETATEYYEAVGTIRPKTETSIQAQITAQVTAVLVSPGTTVKKGETLVLLDNRQFKSRLEQARQGLQSAIASRQQAKQALAAARAGLKQAEASYKRTRKYHASQAATPQQLEEAEAAYMTSKAGVQRSSQALLETESRIKQAEEVVKEAEIALGYTKITAHVSGEILKKLVEPGDLALPGKPLVLMRTSGTLRIEAFVREGLITRVEPGNRLSAEIKTLRQVTDAVVEEIVPYADPKTRTFLVKASLPPIEGLYPGMYAKLMIPVEEKQIVTIPAQAVKRVGQLELVTIKNNGRWKQIYIKTGQPVHDRIEVLSGLNGDETLGF